MSRLLFTLLFIFVLNTSVLAQDASNSGNLTAPAQTVVLNLDNFGAVVVQVTGTWTGTLEFEATVDGTNYVSISAHPPGSATIATATAANGAFEMPVAGYQRVRVRASALGSGTAAVSIRASGMPSTGPLVTVSTPGAAGLTDTELRAAPVPVSAATLPLPTGAATEATLAGLLTDAELRATPVPISGTVTTSGLTDAQLRTTPVPVDGSGATQPISGPVTATSSATLDVVNEAVEIPLSGYRSAGFALWPSSFVGTLIFEHISGNGDWEPTYALDLTGPGWGATVTNPNIQSAEYAAYIGGYERGYRVRVLAYTSGSVLVEMTASTMESHWKITAAGDGSTTLNGVGNVVVGIDSGALARSMRVFNAAPGAADYGLVTRNIPSGTQDVSVASLPLPTGAATEATVAGLLTDTELRATPVPVSGTVTTGGLTDAQLRASAVPVSGPLTDAQLRATPVPVSGGLTDAQLRASAVPVSAVSLPLPTGAATEATLGSVDGKLPALVGGRIPVVLPAGGGGLTDAELRATPVPISGTTTVIGPAADGAAVSGNPVRIGGRDGSGNTQDVLTDTSGRLQVGVVGSIGVQLQAGSFAEANLQTAATANGNGSSVVVSTQGTLNLTINCSACSGGTTINFEATSDGSNWTFLRGKLSGTTTFASSTQTAGITQWEVPVAGYDSFRARISAYSAGTVTVTYDLMIVPMTQTATVETDLGKTEDTAHTSGDVGVMALAVRNDDGATTLAGSNGEYSPIAVNSAGVLFMREDVDNTYTAVVYASAAAASKDHLNMFNGAGTGQVYRIYSITINPDLAAAVTGLVQSFQIRRTTSGGTTCTGLSETSFDSSQPSTHANLNTNSNCTTDPTEPANPNILGCSINGEETQASNSAYGNCYRHIPGNRPFTLREGEGITIRSTALSGAWPVTITVQFTAKSS